MIFPIQLVSFQTQSVFDRWFYSGHIFCSEILKKSVKKKSHHQRLIRLMLHVAAILISFFPAGMVYRLKLFRVRPGRLLHRLKLNCQEFSPDTRFKIFSAQMNLVCFINVCLTRDAQEASIVRFT